MLPVIEESMLLDWLISYWGNQSMKMGPLPVWDPALRLRFQNKCTGLFRRKMGYVLVGCPCAALGRKPAVKHLPDFYSPTGPRGASALPPETDSLESPVLSVRGCQL